MTATSTPTTSPVPPTTSAPFLECPHCRELLVPGSRFCTTCGQPLAGSSAADPATAPELLTFECQQCGAVVAVDPNSLTQACPFCNTPYAAANPTPGTALLPEFVLPFTVSRPEAEQRFAAWRASVRRWREPEAVAALAAARLRGVYVPYWGFQGRVAARWAARIGEDYQETETYTDYETVPGADGRSHTQAVTRTRIVTRTDWYPLANQSHAYYRMRTLVASRGLPERVLADVGSFRLEELRAYEPGFLLGWLAELPGLGRDEALAAVRERMLAEERQRVLANLPGDRQELTAFDAQVTDVFTDLLLLPLWVATFQDGKERRTFLLNGQSGLSGGQAPPWDRRYLFAVLLVLSTLLLLALALLAALAMASR